MTNHNPIAPQEIIITMGAVLIVTDFWGTDDTDDDRSPAIASPIPSLN